MKYKKKPVVIDADPFQWGMEDGVQRYNEYIPRDSEKYPLEMRSKTYLGYLGRYDDLLDERGFELHQWRPFIQTLEGRMMISESDMIITGVNGERYPCKLDIFEKTYEKV